MHAIAKKLGPDYHPTYLCAEEPIEWSMFKCIAYKNKQDAECLIQDKGFKNAVVVPIDFLYNDGADAPWPPKRYRTGPPQKLDMVDVSEIKEYPDCMTYTLRIADIKDGVIYGKIVETGEDVTIRFEGEV